MQVSHNTLVASVIIESNRECAEGLHYFRSTFSWSGSAEKQSLVRSPCGKLDAILLSALCTSAAAVFTTAVGHILDCWRGRGCVRSSMKLP